MSDVAAAPIVENVPTSTSDAAEAVIDAFDAVETTGVEVTEDAAPVEASPEAGEVAKAPAVVEKPLTEAEKLLHAAGYKAAKKPDGRDNYIPHSKVVKIIENGINQGKGEFGARYQALETEATQLRTHVEQMRTSVFGDPRKHLEELASVDARYKAFLEPQAAAPSTPAGGEMPQPDLPLPDGSRTYSVEGIQQLIQWAVDAKMLPQVDERLKPYAEREKAEQARAQQDQQQRELHQRTSTQMQEAQTWPEFGTMAADGSLTEFQTIVLGKLQADSAKAAAAGKRPTMTLREAYLEARTERLSEDDTAKRQRILKELNGAAKGTAITRANGGEVRAPGGVSTSDVAARTLARLERGA